MDASTAMAYSDIQDSANTKSSIMKLNHIRQVYFSDAGEVEAIQDISLSIQPGEFVGIVGQSGCGKSTLLSVISGLITPTAGQVVIKGKPVNGTSSQTGYMLQHDTLFEWRTILDNVMLGTEIQGLDKKKARKRANDLLDRYGLAEFKDKFPQELSGGMRQRAALARTMCTQPEILLLDEPFSALDYQTRLAMSDEIGLILKKEGCTVIMVTHDISEAISMSDRIVVLSARPGRIQSEHQIHFPSAGGASLSPMASRDTPEFGQYFQTIWKELDFHVCGSK
jgi:NitT/TauT family transport system ATP-binding protein